ncbi:hypothetical protein [Halomarina oriensis]|uniref:Uncharacterized protein n=1 Tax=Halomarina oriensis TaxID=671145 RepID=A0A6B0GHX3_9EURY|nr:hypothetical protein [Halomarina oriensis]MWG34466.1 hypothetical protein [Halomarina oriensis]
MSPSRRSLLRSLASVGALGSLAGCTGVLSGDTVTPAVSIDDHHALTTLHYVHNVDDAAVAASPDHQFLFLTVSGPTSAVQSPSAFTVTLDGERYRGLTRIGRASTTRQTPGFPDWFVAEGTTSRTLAFRVPRTVGSADATLRHESGGSVPVSPAAVETLRSPARFTVESLSVPERVTARERVPVRATVSNRGGRAERLHATLDTGMFSPSLAATASAVAPGESATVEDEMGFYAGEEETTDVCTFDVGTERATREVRVDPSDTTATPTT